MRDMDMFVCSACVVFYYNGDYSFTNWSASRAEEVAENLKDIEIFIDDDPLITMSYCSGCGERGGDFYRARWSDEAN